MTTTQDRLAALEAAVARAAPRGCSRERVVNVDTGEFAELTAEVARVARVMEVVAMRVEETLAAAFPDGRPGARPAPARRSRRRGDRPGHLRVVSGGQP